MITMGYELKAPEGGEFLSVCTMIVRDLQPKLKSLDKKNPLLKCNVRFDGATVSYASEFGRRYKGEKSNVTLYKYYSQLQGEIRKIEARKSMEMEVIQ